MTPSPPFAGSGRAVAIADRGKPLGLVSCLVPLALLGIRLLGATGLQALLAGAGLARQGVREVVIAHPECGECWLRLRAQRPFATEAGRSELAAAEAVLYR